MSLALRHRSRLWVGNLTVSLALLAGCAADDSDTTSDDSESVQAATGAEPPLNPSTSYPGLPAGDRSNSGAKRDAGARPVSAVPSAAGAPSSEADPAPVSTVTPVAPTAVAVNPFVDTSKDPFSTFGADVDTASYDALRQNLSVGLLPAPAQVRVEDFVNFFKYDYPAPALDAASPFAISLAASPHPLGRSTTLLRVGIQAKQQAAFEKKPTNLVFLVDTSGSMASPDKLPLVQRVIKESLRVLAPTDKISVVSYAGDTTVRLKPTTVSSTADIEKVVTSLQTGGGTNGASGINLAYEQAQAGFIQGGINHVILCTDGDFNIGISSNEALVQLIKQKRATGVTLTALGFGRDNLNDSMMEAVSNAGNGSYSIVYEVDQAVKYVNERLLATLEHVAKDMKIQVELNPALVRAYRLLGYEDRDIADSDFRNDVIDGGEVGAGHRVTALYELVLTGGQVPAGVGVPALSSGETSAVAREVAANQLVLVKVRSKPVSATDADPASEVSSSLTPADIVSTPTPDLAWASAVASFAEQLRKSPYVGAGELDAVERIVSLQKDRDTDRSEFVSLLAKARPLLSK